MGKIKLVIADDNEQYRRILTLILSKQEDFEVVTDAANGQDLLEKLSGNSLDLILMDIRMPILNGIETTKKIVELYPQAKIIALSQYDFEYNIIEMYKCGVKSFLGKEESHEELFKAIRIVNGGGAYMTDKCARIVQQHLLHFNLADESRSAIILNDFEQELLHAICEGLSSTQIGKILYRSPRTIEEHRANLYKKFNVSTKEELLREVYKRKLL